MTYFQHPSSSNTVLTFSLLIENISSTKSFTSHSPYNCPNQSPLFSSGQNPYSVNNVSVECPPYSNFTSSPCFNPRSGAMRRNPILPGMRCGCWPLEGFEPGPPGIDEGNWIGLGISSSCLEEWLMRSRIGTSVWFWSEEVPGMSSGTETVRVLTKRD